MSMGKSTWREINNHFILVNVTPLDCMVISPRGPCYCWVIQSVVLFVFQFVAWKCFYDTDQVCVSEYIFVL